MNIYWCPIKVSALSCTIHSYSVLFIAIQYSIKKLIVSECLYAWVHNAPLKGECHVKGVKLMYMWFGNDKHTIYFRQVIILGWGVCQKKITPQIWNLEYKQRYASIIIIYGTPIIIYGTIVHQ